MGKWEFLPNPGREEEGLGHAGIETFKGSPYSGIARESSQNSLDAAARNPDGQAAPVHLVFRRLSVPASEIPGLQDLKATLQSCFSQAKERKLKKEKDFFDQAIQVANQASIPVLLVEDYGTTGLIGPAVQGMPFHALVKSSGVSKKAEADAGGSFGIGKNAAFAISRLRTVFYSTCYGENGRTQLAQGKSVLVSHEAESGAHNRATGYWGDPQFMPIDDKEKLPVWLRRSDIGTTVASIGFIEEPDWHWQMVETLIRNFFSAINRGTIRFTVQSKDAESLDISSEALESLFDRVEIRNAADSAGTIEELDFSKAMLLSLKSADAHITTETFADIGTFRMTLAQSEGFPRKVGILRNGMYIADNLRHFGHAMARFPMSRDFVALIEPEDAQTSARVRDMESPRHDEISAERLDDLKERKRLKSAMKKVGEWIRSTIRSATTKPAGPEILLQEMNRFFSRPSAGLPIPDPGNKNDDPERTRLVVRTTQDKPLLGSGSAGASGSSGGLKPSSTKGGKTTGRRPGSGRGSTGGRGGKHIPFDSLRNLKSADGRERVITLTPRATGSAFLELTAVGVANDESLEIRSVDGKPGAKSPRINLIDGDRISVTIELEMPYHGPISIVLTPDLSRLMRIKNSARFPYPVLAEATGDYGPQIFNLSLEIDEEAITGGVHLQGELQLDDASILKLIETEQAAAGLMIYCQGTYLDIFERYDLGKISLDLSGGKVRGAVHVRGVVVSTQDNLKLESDSIDKEFSEHSRTVSAGDLIAMTKEFTFEAGLEKLAPMESIFRMKVHEDLPEGLFSLDLDGESIVILAAPDLYQFLSLLRDQPAKDTLLSALYLPVVMCVLEEMSHDSDYSEQRWHGVMSARCNAEGIDLNNLDLAHSAQALLDAPLGYLKTVFEKAAGA